MAELRERLYRRTRFMPKTGCIEWQGGLNHKGYGLIDSGKGTRLRTHRAAWILANGSIPEGECVCHHCDNPACVYVGHLFLGTPRDNTHDMLQKGREARGEKNGYSKLTEKQVHAIRQDHRTIRAIAKDYDCHWGHIGNIKSGKTWAWATGGGETCTN